MRMKYGKVVFGYKDSWDSQTTLGVIIHDWLVNFKKVLIDKMNHPMMGVPNKVMTELYPDTHEYTDEQLKEGFEHWLFLLDEMIFAFSNDEPEYSGSFKREVDHGVEKEDGLRTWNMQPDDLSEWNKFLKECDEYAAKVEAGRVLFGKYFSSMWW